MVTTKFKAWAHGSPTLAGIPLQLDVPDSRQERQPIQFKRTYSYFDPYQVTASSTASSAWHADYLKDSDPETSWSSNGHSTADNTEWFAFWFPSNDVNLLELTPRRTSGKALGFPETIEIYYSAGTNDWRYIRTVNLTNPEDDISDSILISLDMTVKTDGFLVKATKLRTDDFGNYYFQMAHARARYCTVTFSESEAKNAAGSFPSSLFFFGDEPDLHLPADEYARVYDKFVAAVKSGSSIARVSPAGFTFDNRIYGSRLTEYAEKFLSKVTAQVDEWRFHFFSGDSDTYEKIFSPLAKWSEDHGGKKMVIGSFGMVGVPETIDVTYALTQQMKGIKGDPRIIEAVYWSYSSRGNHKLSEDNGLTLTVDGKTYLANL